MLIDIIFLILLLFAIFKGLSRGFIVGLFSIVGFIIGLAAAIKLSAIVAGWLESSTNISTRWLPFLSFIIVFIGVVFLIQIGARLLQKTAAAMMLGPIDRIGGVVLYMLIYTIILSTILFFAVQVNIINEETIGASRVYSWVQPIGPFVINSLGKVLPFFQDMFKDLEGFFDHLSEKAGEK